MFTIDLLKGQGIPIKSRPEGVAITLVTIVAPVIIAIAMFSYHLHTKITISVNRREITNYEAKISELSDVVEQQTSFEQEKTVINGALSEVKSTIGKHIQWSPILVTLVENMPDSVVLTRLQTKLRSVRKRVPKPDSPGQMVDIVIPVMVLQMSVSATPNSNSDKAIRDFRDHLRFSDSLGPKLEDIRISQEFDTLGERNTVTYDIDCIFKSEL